MSAINKKELSDELYDSAIVTTSAVAVSMDLVAKKLGGMPLNTPETQRGAIKLGIAVIVSTMGIRYLQDKKILPTDPFSKQA